MYTHFYKHFTSLFLHEFLRILIFITVLWSYYCAVLQLCHLDVLPVIYETQLSSLCE